METVMDKSSANRTVANRWIPLPLDFLLEEYDFTSLRVMGLLGGWIGIIAVAIWSVIFISPTEFLLLQGEQFTINHFFVFYPPLILGTLLLFWVGFEWGFIPLFLSGFVITFSASVTYYWGLLFGVAFILGLAIYALAYYCVPFDPALRDLKSFAFFTVVSFIAAIASSLGSFIWSDFFDLSSYETITLWKGWWAGMFLQSMLIIAPILYLLTPWITSKRKQVFPRLPVPKVTLPWIYSAIGSVVVVLLLFVIGARILGTEVVYQQIGNLNSDATKMLLHTSESLQMVSWISIGLVLVLGSGSIYLVGRWNKNLQDEVERKTEELVKSQHNLAEALSERDLLLDSIHDRVRNNLTMVLALLELQLKGEKGKSNEEILKDSHSRIRTLALIHETMVESNSFEEVNMKNFAVKLSNRVQKSFESSNQDIEVSMNVEELQVHIDNAVPIAMILNELLANAYMHGFNDLEKGVVFISLQEKNSRLYLEVRDNGRPLPLDFDEQTKKTLGFKMIRTMVRQLNGELTVVDRENPYFRVVLPGEVLEK